MRYWQGSARDIPDAPNGNVKKLLEFNTERLWYFARTNLKVAKYKKCSLHAWCLYGPSMWSTVNEGQGNK